MKALRFLILTALLLLPGCWLFDIDDNYEFEFDTIITDSPANLYGLNTDRDDYNSMLPYYYQCEPSNRYTVLPSHRHTIFISLSIYTLTHVPERLHPPYD